MQFGPTNLSQLGIDFPTCAGHFFSKTQTIVYIHFLIEKFPVLLT